MLDKLRRRLRGEKDEPREVYVGSHEDRLARTPYLDARSELAALVAEPK